MEHRQIVGLLLGLCTAAGCGSTESDNVDAATESVTTGAGTQTLSTSATTSVTATTSSSTTTTGGGNGGAATDGTSTTAGDTTGVGGGAGNANATSETSTSAGGSGGGDVSCPSEPPAAESECPSAGQRCVYEDCAGAGRSIATCSEGAWSVNTSACLETFSCHPSLGGECNAGELCLIHAGGAISQTCVPNTCGTGPVECDCAEGCFDYCRVDVVPEQGITIMCNTCTSDQCA